MTVALDAVCAVFFSLTAVAIPDHADTSKAIVATIVDQSSDKAALDFAVDGVFAELRGNPGLAAKFLDKAIDPCMAYADEILKEKFD